MQIGVNQFVVFQAGQALTAGIPVLPVGTGNVGGIGKGKRKRSVSRWTVEKVCMRHTFLRYRLYQPLF
jgi:hypothetical protein